MKDTRQTPLYYRAQLSELRLIVVVFLLTAILLLTTSSISTASGQLGEKTYSRIISLYSAHTENLVSMGAADQLVGISLSDNYPPEILDKKKYSYREDPERFIAANPDLILIRPMIERSYPQLIAKIREAGIAVVSLQPTSVDGIFEYWRQLGKLCGRTTGAEEMIKRFTEELKEIQAEVAQIPLEKRPRVYFESMHRKMKTFAPTSIALFVLEQAGGRNVATDAKQIRNTNIAAYSKERILAHAHEIDVFVAQRGRMNPVGLEEIRNETGFNTIKAIQQNKIILIDEHLVSRPTMRLLEGIRQLHVGLYPDFNIAKGGSQ